MPLKYHLLHLFIGNCMVPVADCNKKYYNSQSKGDMEMRHYLNYWMDYIKNNYLDGMPLLYLKDWHCPKLFPNAPIYDVPQFFASDWLNEYYIANPDFNDDYRFVYMGPRGTWTPLHMDVFGSYSWSANIVGRKRWLLFPPGQEDFLRDTYGQLIYDATSEELNDYKKYKTYDKRIIKYIDVIQKPGEIIFVPSGWYHQVWNLEDTISINHNWINGCNILNVWRGLKEGLSSVMKEVNDCKDMSNWAEHCQLILKSTHGMDYIMFFDFIIFIAKRRLNMILKKDEVTNFKKYTFGINHCIFDLNSIRLVLIDFIRDAEEKGIYDLICEKQTAHKLLRKIVLLLQSQDVEPYFML
ncbi:jumonji domain containing 4 isoform X2 [Calliopsis andreniformis]|uniref:jumonji domain containing 4 isoform X2 n=1 Tax=Calliopsis andreniformis TaxID=337506 RepID=UPI003FCC9DD0